MRLAFSLGLFASYASLVECKLLEMADISELLHALFVLITTVAYALPMWEGIQRRSLHHTVLFASQGVLSFVLHCEETGLCAPLKARVHAGLTQLSSSLVYYLLFIMLGVVFEIQSETLLRLVGAVSCLIYYYMDPMATGRNVMATFAISAVVLLADVARKPRSFNEKYWKRLTVIAGMALLGVILLRVLNLLWVWHGIWHVYFIGATYLLLVAQRVKRQQSRARQGATGASAPGGAGSTTSMHGTPLKRRGGQPAVGRGGEGAAAIALDGDGGGHGSESALMGATEDGGKTAVV